MYSRIIGLEQLLTHRSLFLFGARQTGKSTLVHHRFADAVFFDLLAGAKLVVIDEVQKLPGLLDEVQLMIERDKELRFLLTGSSARKLKRGGANLLAGRAWVTHLHPLVFAEVGPGRLLDRLNHGSLPAVMDSELPREDLKAYVGTYLREEIRAEGLTRSIENFSRFLTVAATCNGEQLNYTAVGSDAGVPPLPAYRKTVKRKPVATSKFYFFDVGVANTLLKRSEIVPGSETFGKALEHLIFLEIRAMLDYARGDAPFTYWRSLSGAEVDFLVGDRVAIEVKAKDRVTRRDQSGLHALAEDIGLDRKLIVCNEPRRRWDDTVEIVPIEEFLSDLWAGRLF